METKINRVVLPSGKERWQVRLRITNGGVQRHLCRRFRTLELAEAALVADCWTKAEEDAARLARRRAAVVYLIAADSSGLVKIGQAVDVPHRLMNLQSGSPVRLYLLATFEGHDGRELEKHLHRELAAQRQHGEWFDLGVDPLAVVSALVA